jgi:hypothetical protein
MNRPKTYTIAAILQFLVSVFSVVASFPVLMQGANAVDQAGDSPPFLIVMLGFSIGLLGLVSAYGVWRNQKWGVILTIILRAIDGLSALPGLLYAPTIGLTIAASIGVVLAIVVIALLLWPKPTVAPVSRNA